MNGPTRTERAALEALAARHGVLASYEDTARRRRQTPSDILVAVLGALGVPIDRPGDASALLATPSPAAPVLDPVVVLEADRPGTVHLREGAGPHGDWSLRESGGSDAFDGEVRAGRIELPPLPVGFWDLEVGAGHDEPTRTRLLVAPPRAPLASHLEHTWGAFVPLYAVRDGDRSGHLGDVDRLARRLARDGGRIVSVLPLLATFLGDGPFEYSPYQPVSRRFFSELYLDPERLPVTGPLPDLPAAPLDGGLVDHRLLDRRAAAIVRHVQDRLTEEGVARADFEHFVESHPDLRDYATFRAAVERHGPRPAHLDGDPDRVEHHLVVQWVMERQLSGLRQRLASRGQALALDLPIGCHPDGYDTFRRPDLYAPASTGAPPDDFFQGGQDWGFPPPHPVATRVDGHREFTAAVEALARHAGVLRIDHVLGLNRLWWVPPGGRPDEGAYVRYPLDELLAVLRIVAHRHDTVMVGENLGTVPPEVTSAMARSGILGMHEEQFVIGDPPRDGLPAVTATTVAGMNTHDMVPFAGFWQGADLRDHVALGFRDDDDLPAALDARRAAIERYRIMVAREIGRPVDADRWAVLAAATERLARSPAAQVMITLEDLWGESEPQNVPGTHRERPNWRRPLRRSIDDFDDVPGGAVLDVLRELRGGSGASTADDGRPATTQTEVAT